MSGRALKLKQASAVLQVRPKDLQNLVQFGVVKPKRGEGTYLFGVDTLLNEYMEILNRRHVRSPSLARSLV